MHASMSYAIIDSNSDWSPIRCQPIIWANIGLLWIRLWNKLLWNFNQKSNIFIQENAFEKVICKKAAIFSGPQCVNTLRASIIVLTHLYQRPPTSRSWCYKRRMITMLLPNPVFPISLFIGKRNICQPVRSDVRKWSFVKNQITGKFISNVDPWYHDLKLLVKWYDGSYCQSGTCNKTINKLRPRQNGRYFADYIFKCIF